MAAPGRKHQLKVEVIEAIQLFPFGDFGLDDVDPEDPNAEWVEALARVIVDRILEV